MISRLTPLLGNLEAQHKRNLEKAKDTNKGRRGPHTNAQKSTYLPLEKQIAKIKDDLVTLRKGQLPAHHQSVEFVPSLTERAAADASNHP
jgi:hypothetical protein